MVGDTDLSLQCIKTHQQLAIFFTFATLVLISVLQTQAIIVWRKYYFDAASTDYTSNLKC